MFEEILKHIRSGVGIVFSCAAVAVGVGHAVKNIYRKKVKYEKNKA